MQLLAKLLICFLLALQVGCKSENPLTLQDPKTAAADLHLAAKQTETQMRLTQHPDGHFYASCVRHNDIGPRCNAILSAMVKRLNQTARYKTLTSAHLTDQKMWKTISEYYAALVFTTFS